MGTLEKESHKRRRKGEVQAAVLATVGIAGMLLVAAAAPNVLQLLRYVPKSNHRFNNQAKTVLIRLSEKGLVRFVNKNGKRYAELTETGRIRMNLSESAMLARREPKRWDKRWRVVMFDIPEKRRRTRDVLRSRMREMGFLRLQDSAWVYPYDCEDLVQLIKADLGLGKNVIYMIAEIDNDRCLRLEFGLK